MQKLRRDLFYAVRTLAKSPGFSAAVVGILALGIGANTAIFSVVNAVILRQPPYPEADRLVMLPASHRPDEAGTEVSMASFLDWRRESRSFLPLGAFGPASVNLTAGGAASGAPERVEAAAISPGGFAALGTKPLLGRPFLPDEERESSRVAILSWSFWKTRFASDPHVVGRMIRLSGYEYPVVGVMPPEFTFPRSDVQIWMPLRITESRAKNRQSRWLYAFGRLKDGVSLSAARQEMDALTAALAREHPESDRDWGVRLVPLREHLGGGLRPALLILLATVLVVLGVACANVANLQLARAAGRRREMAIRAAMGASAGDVLRQLLLEGAALAAAGGLLGLLLARASLGLLVAWSAAFIPRLQEVSIDGKVLLFTLAVSLATGVLFGLVPARRAMAPDLVGDLHEGERGASSGKGSVRFRRVLTAGEIAGALVLLVGAGLLLASLSRLQRVEPGFDPRGVLTAEVVLPAARYPDTPRRAAFFRELVARVSAIPGVEAAAGVAHLPFSGSNATEGYAVDGEAPPAGPAAEVAARVVTPGYFHAMRIALLRGRDFSADDSAGRPGVLVVNRAFAELHWPRQSPLGRRIRLNDGKGAPLEIVGVVGDIHHRSASVPPVPEVYVSYDQDAADAMVLVARSSLPPADLASKIAAHVAALDPEQPVSHTRTLERVLAESTSVPRFHASLLGAFAGLAIVLSALGIYSVISYSVAQRRQEFAIRSALGARRRDVLALVLGEGMAVAAAGVAAGTAAAWVAGRALASLLFGVRPNDPAIFAAAAVALAGVALAATLVPAWRAARIAPAAALRSQ